MVLEYLADTKLMLTPWFTLSKLVLKISLINNSSFFP